MVLNGWGGWLRKELLNNLHTTLIHVFVQYMILFSQICSYVWTSLLARPTLVSYWWYNLCCLINIVHLNRVEGEGVYNWIGGWWKERERKKDRSTVKERYRETKRKSRKREGYIIYISFIIYISIIYFKYLNSILCI